MAKLARGLDAEAKRLEPDFVRLTDGLVRIHGRTGEMAALGKQLAEQIGARLEQIRADGIGKLVDGSYAALQASLAASTSRQAGLVDNTTALASLEQHGRQVKGIATRLGVTRLGFSIECTRLTQQEAEFRDFVAELSQLERSVATLGAELTQQAATAKGEQARCSEVIRRGLGELQRLSANCEKVAHSASAGIEAVLGACGTIVTEVATATQAIRTHSEELVYFLQFGDIVRQRLEHVAHALAVEQTEPTTVARTTAVQVAQLEAIGDEIGAACTKLGAAFGGLAQGSRELVHTIERLDVTPGDATDTSRGASLTGLQVDIRNMHDLRQRAEQLGSGSTKAAAAAAEVAGRMGSHVDAVKEANARMHMMALNAIVNTSRLGPSAAALGVLSIQVHEVAKESAVIVAAILPLLEQVRCSVTGVAEVGADAAGDCSPEATERGLHQLGELTAWVARTAREATTIADGQQQAIDEARRNVAFLTGLRDRIGRHLAELCQARLELGSLANSAATEVAAEDLTIYTMASERDAHLRALGSSAAVLAPPIATVPGNEIGDNVELF